MMDASHLRCFVAVAEELNFSRAAERLNITQSPLSRQIQLLERKIGCAVFRRTSRAVVLTEAGRTLLPEARRILRQLENAQKTARDVSLGRGGVVRCGFTAATAYRFLPALLRSVSARIPGSSIELREMVSFRQIAALDAGELEIALLRPSIDLQRYCGRLVAREKLVLAIPTGHDLCAREFVQWDDLAGVNFIMYDSVEAKYFDDLITSFLTEKRVWPNIVQRLTQIHSILSLVRANVGVAIVPESAPILEISDIEYRDFFDGDAPFAELMIVWRKETHNPLVPAVVEIAESLL